MQVGGGGEKTVDSCTRQSLEVNKYLVKANPRGVNPGAGSATPLGAVAGPSQDIRSLHSFLALVNHPCIAPSIYFAHTIAILLHD